MPSRVAKRTVHRMTPGRRTLAGWRARSHELKLSVEDLPLLDNVLSIAPLLRVVVAIGQEARRRKVRYPVKDASDLQSYLDDKSLCYANHRVDKEAIARMMPDSWFPLAHEGELLSRIHLALLRCEAEAAALAPAPAILNERT
jgi:hypothetical protein